MILSQEKSIGVRIYILPGSVLFHRSQPFFVIPFMALFVERVGCYGQAVPFYALIAVASSSVTSAIMSPIWGLSNYGRKPMIAGFHCHDADHGRRTCPFRLLALGPALNGVFSTLSPNSTALIASQVPMDQSGLCPRALSTGVVRNMMGPLIGDSLHLGMRNVFPMVGFFLFLVSS